MSDAKVLKISLDGANEELHFPSYSSLKRWIVTERERWDWLNPTSSSANQFNIAINLQTNFDHLQQIIHNNEASQVPVSNNLDTIQEIYSSRRLIWSQSVVGDTIAMIIDQVGIEAAAFAAGLHMRIVNLGSATSAEQIKGAVLYSFPAGFDAELAAKRFALERANFRDAARAAARAHEAALAHAEQRAMVIVERGKGIAAKAFTAARASWRSDQQRFGEATETSIDAINAVRMTYQEFMKLKAPVEYWQAKSVEHKFAEKKAWRTLTSYFGIAIIALAVTFYAAVALLLSSTTKATSPIVAVIVSAGLAAISALIFWVGRILTKLYLSEHHLRYDASERAVMTETYLSLTETGAATESDRQIILGALFRSSSDGIVKDDGMPEIGLAAFLSKVGVK
ncbi:DUF6161 domain-containing protein [Sphingomonas qilianensis]|uniref:DUF6161 domain-containing protein n=1 Tax=Sphingomonas qilianensis TaxID=1736690 RepID=A0ABU9XWE7_9SPHN